MSPPAPPLEMSEAKPTAQGALQAAGVRTVAVGKIAGLFGGVLEKGA